MRKRLRSSSKQLRKEKKHQIVLLLVPFVISVLLGGIFYSIGNDMDSDLKGVFHSISATFFSIPLLFFGYQAFADHTKSNLEVDIFEYFKAQVDVAVVTLIRHLAVVSHHVSFAGSEKWTKYYPSQEMQDKEPPILGFHMFRTFQEEESIFDKIIKSGAFHSTFSSTQKTALVKLAKTLVGVRVIVSQLEVSKFVPKPNKEYLAIRGTDFSPSNKEYPNRYILLKRLSGDKNTVVGFGDFPIYLEPYLTTECNLQNGFLEVMIPSYEALSVALQRWIQKTGNEVLLRPDNFRIRNNG